MSEYYRERAAGTTTPDLIGCQVKVSICLEQIVFYSRGNLTNRKTMHVVEIA